MVWGLKFSLGFRFDCDGQTVTGSESKSESDSEGLHNYGRHGP